MQKTDQLVRKLGSPDDIKSEPETKSEPAIKAEFGNSI